MRVIYIADDGTQFDDVFKCEDHEWKLNHPGSSDVHMFDADGNELSDILSEKTYHSAEVIVAESEEALDTLKALADYTGYCCYYDITSVGKWRFNNIIGEFIMENADGEMVE